ncbi:MAG: MBL fold metallo-hydrolase [Solirubrobacterales bacterium]|nr:MBL fold metallo-hydrolase [Solirubrobacterales bacterium]
MIFRQITHDDLGCASYLVGDEDAAVAAVVDPKFAIEEYLELARYLGISIVHILETHTHADHVSGHGRLASATGARIHIHREAGAAYEHEPFDDGWELSLGAVRIRAMHTPGHRPEHTAFVLTDTRRSEEPWAVLTGDSLFVGDVARPDLAVEKDEGAREIFHSLRDHLLTLPPATEVWPGHLGGSMCGGPGMDLKIASTVAFERAHNEMLQAADEAGFVTRAIRGLGPQPPNFKTIVELNRGELITDGVEAVPLTSRQVTQRARAGAMLVDVRTDLQFDEAHIPGAICIPALHAGFGTRLAWLAGREDEIVLVGRADEDARRAAQLAVAVGIREFGGYLAGGMTQWRTEQRPVDRIERLEVERLAPLWQSDETLQILDVRERHEREAGYIPGSRFTPWHDLDRPPGDVDSDRPVAVICASGLRAAVAASILQCQGLRHLLHVVGGGVPTWAALGHPIEVPQPAAA